MISKKLIVGALVLGGALASGLAQARDNVQWSVSIGVPVGVPVYSQPYPVYAQPQPVFVQPQPVYVQPQPVFVQRPYYYGGYRQAAWWDRNGNGIPDRYERRVVYGYGHDRDHDGIPNWQDRHDNRGGHR